MLTSKLLLLLVLPAVSYRIPTAPARARVSCAVRATPRMAAATATETSTTTTDAAPSRRKPLALFPGKPLVRGSIAVGGGVLAHLILGSMYCWGNFLSYMPKNLLFFDGAMRAGVTPDAVQVMPLALIGINVGMPVGARLTKALGPRATTLLGCALMALGTFLGSFQTRLAPFMLWYSGLAGIGTGLAYSTPMIAGWSWFPASKGLVNGLTLFGFGAGAYVFNAVGTGLAAKGLPWGPMLRRLAAIYAAASLAGAAFVKAKPPLTVEEECDVTENIIAPVSPPEYCEAPGAEFGEAVRSARFRILWLVGLFAFMPGITMMGLYKVCARVGEEPGKGRGARARSGVGRAPVFALHPRSRGARPNLL